MWSYICNGANETIRCRKRRSEDEGGPVTSKSRKDTADTITKVDEIVEILTKKHESNNYSVEQFRAWAHLIQMGKHSSSELPPDKPFFKSRNKLYMYTLKLQ